MPSINVAFHSTHSWLPHFRRFKGEWGKLWSEMLLRSGQPMRRWQKLPCHSLLAHPTWTTVSSTFPSLLTTDPWSPPNSLILELKGKLSSLRISPYMPHSSQTLPHGPKTHTGLSHSVFPLRSTLNGHGRSMPQESSNRSLLSQTNCYSYQVLAISPCSWHPGATPTRALTSTGGWVWCLLPSSPRSPRLTPAISASPPSLPTNVGCACHLLSPQNWSSTSGYGIQKSG